MRRSTPHARTVDLDRSRNAADARVAARFETSYASAIERMPSGRVVFHGLPFDLGPAADAMRWILLDTTIELDLTDHGPASHLLVAHVCDAWRDDSGRRPAGLAVGHVVPVGEPLARYTVVDRSGRTTTRAVRRRFEVNEGILGWGSGAFAAVPHLEHEVLDWRGPGRCSTDGQWRSCR